MGLINRTGLGIHGSSHIILRVFGSRLVEFFLRHASTVCPLNDAGKLKIASDMTQLELGLNQLFTSSGMSFDSDAQLSGLYKSLRAFKYSFSFNEFQAAFVSGSCSSLESASYSLTRSDCGYPAFVCEGTSADSFSSAGIQLDRVRVF